MTERPDWFWHWAAWRISGKKGPRPKDVPVRIPSWAWVALENWVRNHPSKKPKPPPPPTPPPPPPKPPASWPFRNKPLVFTAWDPSAARSGPWDVAVITSPGVAPTWAVDGVGVIPQAESGPQQQVAVQAFESSAYTARALVATQGGWLPPTPFLEIGVNVVMVEAYQNEDPAHTPAQLYWQAGHDGWPYVIPVVGVYHGYPLASYDLRPYGKNFAVYLAEEMTEDDWTELARLAS